MTYFDIIVGSAKIVVAKNARDEPIGWALPGGKITQNADEAIKAAWVLSKKLKEGKK